MQTLPPYWDDIGSNGMQPQCHWSVVICRRVGAKSGDFRATSNDAEGWMRKIQGGVCPRGRGVQPGDGIQELGAPSSVGNVRLVASTQMRPL